MHALTLMTCGTAVINDRIVTQANQQHALQ
jgi:hypothetical protein